MKTNVYLGLVIRIVVFFGVVMLGTYIPDHLRGFLGDIPCEDNCGKIDEHWKWGVRHYWYFWMMVCIFILNAVNVVMSSVNLVTKNYYPEVQINQNKEG
jgi:hypothetical protein